MKTTLVLQVEMDLVHDAIASLQLAHERLSRRHGDAFRALERRIEALGDGPLSFSKMPSLEPGRLVVLPPAEATALIAEARALGVL